MATRRYTRDDLFHLRSSPLVQRPENLPAIEQWIDDPPQPAQNAGSTNKRQAQAKPGGEASPMGNFSTGQRPGLIPRSSRPGPGDDNGSRGMFSSGRTKISESFDKHDAASAEEQDGLRSRFFSDRQSSRKSMNEKDHEGARESWTTVRDRRAALGRDDTEGRDRQDRFGRRDKEHDTERRNGYADKLESRWGERRQNGERVGGWRDRERRREPEWMSSGAVEKNPEWMDDSAAAGTEDSMSKRAEDFQKWKDERKLRENNGVVNLESGTTPVESPQPTKDAIAAKPTATLQIDGLVDKSFGNWSEAKGQQEGVPISSKAAQSGSKARPSRFASMFKDTQVKEDSPSAGAVEPKSNSEVHGNAEDEAGFKRILLMLGNGSQGAEQEGPSSPQGRAGGNSMRQKSRFTGFFDQGPRSPEVTSGTPGPFVPPENENFPDGRNATRDYGGGRQGGGPQMLASEEHSRPNRGPTPSANTEQRPPSAQLSNLFLDQPPSRGAATPDVNIQNLLAGQRSQRSQGPDKNSEFLLNLLQNKGSRPTSQQARPDTNFPLWIDQPPNVPETHAPKPRAPPPPGLFEDQILRQQSQEASRAEQQRMQTGQPQQQRAPPGFFDEQSMYLQQQQPQVQRRNYAEQPHHQQQQQAPMPQPPNRRVGGQPNPPQMQIPVGQFSGPPPEFLQSPGAQHQVPPPGFNPHMPRHPPGFHNIPNIFQPPQGPPQGREGVPTGHHGFPGNIAGIMPPNSPPNVPPGFFAGAPPMPHGAPPGFLTQMRSPTDPTGPGMRGVGRGYGGPGYDGVMGGARH